MLDIIIDRTPDAPAPAQQHSNAFNISASRDCQPSKY